MRTYGRTYDVNHNPTWKVVETDANGYNDEVYLTTMVQVLLLRLGESPFYGDWGIPAIPSVLTQIAPDFYVALTQQRFAPHFASLIAFPTTPARTRAQAPSPTYMIQAVSHSGAILPRVTIPTSIPT